MLLDTDVVVQVYARAFVKEVRIIYKIFYLHSDCADKTDFT